jgi:glycosyltransferase involved in cell wall biosynthesis
MASIVITNSYSDRAVPRYFAALAGELASRGHDVLLLVDGQRFDAEREGNPSLRTWPSRRPTRLRDAKYLWRQIRARRPSCIIGNFGATNLSILVGRLLNVRARVAWYHTMSGYQDMDSVSHPWKLKLQRLRKRIAYHFATKIVAVSDAALNDVVSTYRAPRWKCITLRCLLEDPKVTWKGQRKKDQIVCVGRLHAAKGQETLIRAIALVTRVVRDATVEFVGDGPARAKYEELAACIGVQKACSFRGPTSPHEAIERMASAELVVVPSRAEALGLVNIEAESVGTPVIACDVGGIREVVVDGETGYLVPVGDYEALARRIVKLLTEPGLRERMGAAGRRRFEAHFSYSQLSKHADLVESWMLDRGTVASSDRHS